MLIATNVVNTTNLSVSEAISKIASHIMTMQPGDNLEIIGSYPNFDKDIRMWCAKLNTCTLLYSVRLVKRWYFWGFFAPICYNAFVS